MVRKTQRQQSVERRRRDYLKIKKAISLDFFAGYAFFWIIIAYVIGFGVFRTHGFVITQFEPAFLSILIPIWLIDGLKGTIESFASKKYLTATQDLNKVTVIIACKDGEDVIGATLRSLLKKFKPKQIILASNGSTDRTCEIGRAYKVRVLDIREPLGKARAINYALDYVKTSDVLLLDDDTLVGRARIPNGLLIQGYDGVAFRVLVRVTNWVSRFQMYEYRKTTDLGKRYHSNKASVQNISGAIGLFKTEKLRDQIWKHSGEFSGEDLQRTLLIHLSEESRGVVLARSTVITRPPTTIVDLFKQRTFGWFPGLYANFWNYIRILFGKHKPAGLRFDAFYNTFLVMLLDVIRLLSLPILILYPWYFVIMYGAYLILESVTYIQSGANEPYWVVIFYPLYGLFGFITRACAFVTFVYRRLCVRLTGNSFFDNYRFVKPGFKMLAIVMTLLPIVAILVLNVTTFFVKPVLNIGF